MSTKLRKNRKNADDKILRLNGLGISLTSVARILNCHPTSITLRLKSLNVPPADTRRAFMEGIYFSLSDSNQDLLADLIESIQPMTVKDYVRELIVQDLEARREFTLESAPTEEAQVQQEQVEMVKGDKTIAPEQV